jgi:hypothetical protein
LRQFHLAQIIRAGLSSGYLAGCILAEKRKLDLATSIDELFLDPDNALLGTELIEFFVLKATSIAVEAH